ncbi:hypothetical protein R9U75_03000, partial [Escherichia coli]
GVLITGSKLKAFRNPQPSWGFSVHNKKPPKSGGYLLLVRFAAFPAGCITVVMQARLSGDNTRQ